MRKFTVRLTDTEYLALKASSEKTGKSIAATLRGLVCPESCGGDEPSESTVEPCEPGASRAFRFAAYCGGVVEVLVPRAVLLETQRVLKYTGLIMAVKYLREHVSGVENIRLGLWEAKSVIDILRGHRPEVQKTLSSIDASPYWLVTLPSGVSTRLSSDDILKAQRLMVSEDATDAVAFLRAGDIVVTDEDAVEVLRILRQAALTAAA